MAEDRYDTQINKAPLHMGTMKDMLNNRWHRGWRLHSIFEQGGSTVMIFERRD